MRTRLVPLILLSLAPACGRYPDEWEALRANAQGITPGMTQAEVIAILGPPDDRAAPRRANKAEWDAFWYTANKDESAASFRAPDYRIVLPPTVRIDFDPDRVTRVEEIPYTQIPFDSDDWKRSSAPRRGCMIEDLLDNHELDGSRMSQEQVVALLGPPDPDPYFTPSDWVYCLGPQRSGLPIDNDWLTFVFDQDARVERVYIATD